MAPTPLASNRQARNAFLATIAIAGIAFLNLSNAITQTLTPAGALWQHIAEIAINLLLLIVVLSVIPFIRRGDIERAIWRLVVSFLVAAVIQVSLREAIGLAQGVMTAMLLSAIGYLTLSPRQAARTTALAFSISALMIIFDLYANHFFTRLPTPDSLARSTTNLAAFVFLFQVIILISQARTLSLNTKIANLFSLFTVMAVFLIGMMSIRILSDSLTQQQNRALLGSAQQVANRLDQFIVTNLDILRAEAIQPDLSLYLLIRKTSFFDPTTRNRPLQILKLYQSREPQAILSYGLLDENGINVLDTNGSLIGHSEADQEHFFAAFKSGLPHVSPLIFDKDGKGYIYFSAPVRDTQDHVIGVLRAQYDASILQNMVQEFNNLAGNSAFAIIVDENGLFLAHGLQPELRFKAIRPLSNRQLEFLQKANRLPPDTSHLFLDLPGLADGLLNADRQPNFKAQTHIALDEMEASEKLTQLDTDDANAAVSLNTRPWKVIYSQSYELFLEPVNVLRRGIIVAGAILATLEAVLGVVAMRALITPLQRLTEVTAQIAQGDLTARADVQQEDEIGILASTFNAMAEQLSSIINQLENRVAERTRDLERRAIQLQTAAEIGSAAASLHDLDTLLPRLTYLISSRFGFYHVGIFLLDDEGEYAVLRAANSAGGQRMLARGHRLKVGETGIVGFVTSTGKPRIALDVGKDAVYFDNPDLPETRSEMAVPLIAGGKILGALDVQSTVEAAFQPEDVSILQVLADQLAIAIENARLFAQNQQAIEAIRRAYGELSRSAWRRLQMESGILGFVSHESGAVVPLTQTASPSEIRTSSPQRSADGKTLFVPIKIHNLIIG
ncbi:MAG: GAF domain-containing protein, partial [Anaerolineae bacterium]